MLNPLGTDKFIQSHTASSLDRTPKATIDAMEGFGAYLYSGDVVSNTSANGSNYAGLVFEEEISCYDTPRGSVRCVRGLPYLTSAKVIKDLPKGREVA